MNKKNLSLKVDEYTIYLHRGQEESEEIGQKQMALLIACLCKIALRPLVKCLKDNFQELQLEVENTIQKHIHNIHDKQYNIEK